MTEACTTIAPQGLTAHPAHLGCGYSSCERATGRLEPPGYLRVVVTRRCPLRCSYCHAEGQGRLPRGGTVAELDRAELETMLQIAVDMGTRKIKLLGGEALLRPDLGPIVASVKRYAPHCDLSVVTSGATHPQALETLLEAGLDRANVSVHGWSLEAFSRRGGNDKLLDWRRRNLDLLLRHGRPLKVNYVYGGRHDDEDLAELLAWAAQRPLVVGVLDDLNDAQSSAWTVAGTLARLRGPWAGAFGDDDPHSLPSIQLVWSDGLQVELKSSRLGQVAPWRACRGCPARPRCTEGTFALRLSPEGDLRLCMDRPDLSLSLRSLVAKSPTAGALAWADFVGGQQA